jgi:hypothetical protein
VCSCWEEDKAFPVELACRLYVEGERNWGNGIEIGIVLGAREVCERVCIAILLLRP